MVIQMDEFVLNHEKWDRMKPIIKMSKITYKKPRDYELYNKENCPDGIEIYIKDHRYVRKFKIKITNPKAFRKWKNISSDRSLISFLGYHVNKMMIHIYK
jgi:hypothetical protein